MKERNKKPRAREICFPDLSGLFAAFLMRKVEKMKKGDIIIEDTLRVEDRI